LDELGVVPPADSNQGPQLASLRNLLSSGRFEAAESQLAAMAQSGFAEVETEFWRGVLDLRRGNGYDAIRRLRHAQRLSDSPYTIESLALAYYSVSQFHLFESFMLEAAHRLPDAFAPHYYLGRYYASTGVTDFARAKQHLAQSIQLNPVHFRSFYYLGYCHEAERRLDEASREYEQSIRLAESEKRLFAQPYEGMARILSLQDKLPSALDYATKAVSMAPREADAHRILATIYDRQQRSEEAINEWGIVATLDPTDGAAQYRLFRLYRLLGKNDLAACSLKEFKRRAHLYGGTSP
jgi:tetratricopeptide (TPR) repeat protein